MSVTVSALEAQRNALYKLTTYLLTYLLSHAYSLTVVCRQHHSVETVLYAELVVSSPAIGSHVVVQKVTFELKHCVKYLDR